MIEVSRERFNYFIQTYKVPIDCEMSKVILANPVINVYRQEDRQLIAKKIGEHNRGGHDFMWTYYIKGD